MLSWLLKQIVSGFLLRLNGLSSGKRKPGIINFFIFMQTKRKKKKIKGIIWSIDFNMWWLTIGLKILEQNIEFLLGHGRGFKSFQLFPVNMIYSVGIDATDSTKRRGNTTPSDAILLRETWKNNSKRKVRNIGGAAPPPTFTKLHYSEKLQVYSENSDLSYLRLF